jgi:hypothetical protein
MPSRLASLKPFFGAFLLNALLAFPVLYQTYKHYSLDESPMDTASYLTLAEGGPESIHPPFRYRVLTPLLVRAFDFVPGYGIAVDFTTDADAKRLFFHFLLVNFILTIAASAFLFVWLRARSGSGFAWAGSLLDLFGFVTVTANLIPMADAGCHLAIIAALLCLDKNRPVAFMVTALIGVFAKETVILVLGAWIVVQSVGDLKRLRYLALLFPAAAAYLVLTRIVYPAPSQHAFYDPAFVLEGFLRVFDPLLYRRSFLFHAALGHLSLIAAFAGWAWLRWGRRVRVTVDRELWVFFGLLVLGVAMDIGNNAARLAFMAFPAVALFQTKVMEALGKSERSPPPSEATS